MRTLRATWDEDQVIHDDLAVHAMHKHSKRTMCYSNRLPLLTKDTTEPVNCTWCKQAIADVMDHAAVTA